MVCAIVVYVLFFVVSSSVLLFLLFCCFVFMCFLVSHAVAGLNSVDGLHGFKPGAGVDCMAWTDTRLARVGWCGWLGRRGRPVWLVVTDILTKLNGARGFHDPGALLVLQGLNALPA